MEQRRGCWRGLVGAGSMSGLFVEFGAMGWGASCSFARTWRRRLVCCGNLGDMQRSRSKSSKAKSGKSRSPRRTPSQIHAANLRKRTEALARKMRRDKARADAKAVRDKARADAKAARAHERAMARAMRDKARAEAKAKREKRRIEVRMKREAKRVAQSTTAEGGKGKRRKKPNSTRRRLRTLGSPGEVATLMRTARDLESEVAEVLAAG